MLRTFPPNSITRRKTMIWVLLARPWLRHRLLRIFLHQNQRVRSKRRPSQPQTNWASDCQSKGNVWTISRSWRMTLRNSSRNGSMVRRKSKREHSTRWLPKSILNLKSSHRLRKSRGSRQKRDGILCQGAKHPYSDQLRSILKQMMTPMYWKRETWAS